MGGRMRFAGSTNWVKVMRKRKRAMMIHMRLVTPRILLFKCETLSLSESIPSKVFCVGVWIEMWACPLTARRCIVSVKEGGGGATPKLFYAVPGQYFFQTSSWPPVAMNRKLLLVSFLRRIPTSVALVIGVFIGFLIARVLPWPTVSTLAHFAIFCLNPTSLVFCPDLAWSPRQYASAAVTATAGSAIYRSPNYPTTPSCT
jgi:hypothetical protein